MMKYSIVAQQKTPKLYGAQYENVDKLLFNTLVQVTWSVQRRKIVIILSLL